MNRMRNLSFLGLAAKAGKVKSGEFSTEKSVKTGQSHLVIVAEDASDNTKKMFRNMCAFYKVPLSIYGTKDELGAAIGKQYRASISIEDAGFADSMSKKLGTMDNGGTRHESI